MSDLFLKLALYCGLISASIFIVFCFIHECIADDYIDQNIPRKYGNYFELSFKFFIFLTLFFGLMYGFSRVASV